GSRRASALLLVLGLCAPSVAAQSPEDRQALAAFDSVLTAMNPEELGGHRDAARAQSVIDPLPLIRQGLVQLRLAQHQDTRQPLDRAEAAMDEAVYRAPDNWPWPWYGLARAKLALAEMGVTAKASMHQPEGDTYRSAAFRALAHSLEADSSFAPAAALLAEVLLPLGERELSGDLQRAVRRAASSGAGPAPLLALGRVYRNLGKPDSALTAFRGFVARGGDSGVGLLEQARALHALSDTIAAIAAYDRGAVAAGKAGRRSYRLDLAWIASPAELAAYDSLPLDSISPWLMAFWSNRDAAQLRAPGERLLEHLRRWRYVHEHFQVH